MKEKLASWAIDSWALEGFAGDLSPWRHPELVSGSFQLFSVKIIL